MSLCRCVRIFYSSLVRRKNLDLLFQLVLRFICSQCFMLPCELLSFFLTFFFRLPVQCVLLDLWNIMSCTLFCRDYDEICFIRLESFNGGVYLQLQYNYNTRWSLNRMLLETVEKSTWGFLLQIHRIKFASVKNLRNFERKNILILFVERKGPRIHMHFGIDSKSEFLVTDNYLLFGMIQYNVHSRY